MTIKYICLYADSSGESHFKDVEVEFQETDFAPSAVRASVSSFMPATEFGFVTAPSGSYEDGHLAPQRQFLFYLTGQVEVKASDGETRTFGPGDIVLVEDTTGKGHVSRVLGSDQILNAVVRLPN